MEELELFSDEFFPPTKEELEEILETLEKQLENPEYKEYWVKLKIQYDFRRKQLLDIDDFENTFNM